MKFLFLFLIFSNSVFAITCEEFSSASFVNKLHKTAVSKTYHCFSVERSENKLNQNSCPPEEFCNDEEIKHNIEHESRKMKKLCLEWHKKYPQETDFSNTEEGKEFDAQNFMASIKEDREFVLKITKIYTFDSIHSYEVCRQVRIESEKIKKLYISEIKFQKDEQKKAHKQK